MITFISSTTPIIRNILVIPFIFLLYSSLCNPTHGKTLSDKESSLSSCNDSIDHEYCDRMKWRQHDHSKTLLSQLIQPGDLIIYVGHDILHNIIDYIHLVGSHGNLIGIELSTLHFPQLVHRIHTENYQNNTLLLNSHLDFHFHDILRHDNIALNYCYQQNSVGSISLDCMEYMKLSLSRVYDMIGQLCPTMIIIDDISAYHSLKSGYVLQVLISGYRMIQKCYPIIYVNKVTPSNIQAILSFLMNIRYTEIYWHMDSELIDSIVENNNHETKDREKVLKSIGLLVINDKAIDRMMETIKVEKIDDSFIREYMELEYGLIGYIAGKCYISEYLNMSLYQKNKILLEWLPTCIDGTIPPCYSYIHRSYDFINRSYINVTTVAYTPLFHPLYTPNSSYSLENHDCNYNSSYTHVHSHHMLPNISTTVYLSDQLYHWQSDPSVYQIAELYKRIHSYTNKGIDGSSNNNNYSMSYEISNTILWNTTMSPDDSMGETAYNIARIECVAWILSIYNDITFSEHTDRTMEYLLVENSMDRLHHILLEGKELDSLVNGCIESHIKQFTVLHKVSIEAIQHCGFDTIVNNTKSDINDPILSHNIDSFHAMIVEPFEYRYDGDSCLEPVWCNHAIEMQRRIIAWQFPDREDSYLGDQERFQDSNLRRSCKVSKYLIYEPVSTHHGIGSILEQLASALRYAICLNRILILESPIHSALTMTKWRFPGCRRHMIHCYFQSIHGCEEFMTYEGYQHAAISDSGRFIDEYPLRDIQFVRLKGLPSYGPCALCGSPWKSSYTSNIASHSSSELFFDGLGIDRDPTNPSSAMTKPPIDAITHSLTHMGSMQTTIKLPWIAQFIRYIFRPKPWFKNILRNIVQTALIGPKNESIHVIPHPYISLHVRYGMKVLEEELVPIEKYITAMRKKYPYVKNVFLSTETEIVIDQIRRQCPDLNIYHLAHPRLEYLDLPMLIDKENTPNQQDFVSEWVYSMANLYVSIHGDGFIGTLTSNWCALIHHLERTRGDGGYDYFSVDRGSAFTSCF